MSSKEYFNQVAEKWDEMREDLFSTQIRNIAFSHVNFSAGQLAADIGAGTGFITEGLLEKGLEVIAVDQSDFMLKIIKKKFPHLNRIHCRAGVAEKLPIPNNFVNYCFANMCLHHVDSPLQAIKEMARILKPEGKIIITDLDKHNHKFLQAEQHARWLGFHKGELEQWFLEAGLKNIDVKYSGEKCYSKSQSNQYEVEMSILIALGEKPTTL